MIGDASRRTRRPNGTGSVVFRGRHKWIYSTPAGAHRTGFATRAEAEAALNAFVASGKLPPDRRFRTLRATPARVDITAADVSWARRYVFGLARRHPHLADDIYSEAVAALWLAALDYRPSEGVPFRAFARPRVWGGALDFLRNQNRSVESQKRPNAKPMRAVVLKDYEWDRFISSDECVEDQIQRCERLRLLRAAIDELPARHRVMFCEYIFAHRRLVDIAADFGITESRVSQIVKSAGLQIAATPPIRALREAA